MCRTDTVAIEDYIVVLGLHLLIKRLLFVINFKKVINFPVFFSIQSLS